MTIVMVAGVTGVECLLGTFYTFYSMVSSFINCTADSSPSLWNEYHLMGQIRKPKLREEENTFPNPKSDGMCASVGARTQARAFLGTWPFL